MPFNFSTAVLFWLVHHTSDINTRSCCIPCYATVILWNRASCDMSPLSSAICVPRGFSYTWHFLIAQLSFCYSLPKPCYVTKLYISWGYVLLFLPCNCKGQDIKSIVQLSTPASTYCRNDNFSIFERFLYSTYILRCAVQTYLCSFKISIEMHIQWQIASG